MKVQTGVLIKKARDAWRQSCIFLIHEIADKIYVATKHSSHGTYTAYEEISDP